MIDFELLEFDRINIIRDTIRKYGEDNFYLSFSGGKDSTILHYLIDMALPGNKIPRVFINTGIEFVKITEFVNELANNDDRFVIVRPTKSIKETLEKFGYPFKSKEHSLRVQQFNQGKNSNFIYKYINGINKDGSALKGTKYVCPRSLLYQFEVPGKYNYSNLCCQKMKKEPAKKWAKENKKSIFITGMRSEEGGQRARLGCIITDSKGRIQKFHPLIKVDEEFENWFIEKHNIKLCELYYPPYNFERTGCKGCPFNIKIQEELDTLAMFLPNEKKHCEIIWKPVYDEYRRIGYRLNNKITIFD